MRKNQGGSIAVRSIINMTARAAIIGLSVIAVTAASVLFAFADGPEEPSLKKALELARKGSSDEAVSEFTKVIARNPSSADAYYNRGSVYYKQGKLDGAVSDFTSAISLNPAAADAYYNRALAYYKRGSYDKAIADYDRVMELGPGATDALYGRGLAYYRKNNIEQALADFDKVIEMRPDFPLAYSARAVAYFSKRDYGRTLADVNKAMALGFRSRPLKEAAPERPAPAAVEKSGPAIEKVPPVPVTEDPAKERARKERRLLRRIIFYTLYGSLVLCLTAILILVIHIRKIGRRSGK
jgi:tetratricopeptide (TPR) repeat protein